MRTKILMTLAVASQIAAGTALAQGSSGRNVTVLRMSGPQLGVRLEEVDKDVVARLKLKEEKGALVTEILENSAAEKAGIKKDDVIVRFQGESVLTAAQLSRLVRDVPEGRKVDIDVVRAGAPLKVTATIEKGSWSNNSALFPDMDGLGGRLAERMKGLGDMRLRSRGQNLPREFSFKTNEDDPMSVFFTEERGRLGITYNEIEGQLAHYFKAPKDNAILVNSVVEGSAAQKAGIKAGDLIIKLGGSAIENGEDLQESVRNLEPGKATALTVWRDGKSLELTVTVEDERRTGGNLRRRPVS